MVVDVLNEVEHAKAKHGEQIDLPDGAGDLAYALMADAFRARCDGPTPTWRDVLLEEVYEALAESDPDVRRVELTQVAAVCLRWVAAAGKRGPS